MIKKIPILICFIFFSCQAQTGKETKSLNCYHYNTNMKDSFLLTYDYWYELVTNTVYAETNIKEYQKSNILTLINRVKKKDFEFLLREAGKKSGVSKHNGLIVFYYSEGELVTSIVGYLFSDGYQTWKSFLDISSREEIKLHQAKQINQVNFNDLIAIPISSANVYQEIVITIKIENEAFLSKIGNPNQDLFEILR